MEPGSAMEKTAKNNHSTHMAHQGPKSGHSNPEHLSKKESTYWQSFQKSINQVVIRELVYMLSL